MPANQIALHSPAFQNFDELQPQHQPDDTNEDIVEGGEAVYLTILDIPLVPSKDSIDQTQLDADEIGR